MTAYSRPALDLGTFLDDDGAPIPYGHRWDDLDEGGPDDTYSVCRHPQRFAPLQDVARALLEHLESTYEVDHRVEGSVHRLEPRGRDAAALSITFTDLPGVTCTAGVMSDLAYFCGCDHCDEDVLWLVDELERAVFAVVGGRFREWVETTEDGIWASRELLAEDGSRWVSGGGSVTQDAGEQAELRRRLASAPAWWAAWTPRTGSGP